MLFRSVADAFDAMTTSRSYRPALMSESAMETIRSGSGREFDPKCAWAFLREVRRNGSRNVPATAAFGGLVHAEAEAMQWIA